MSKKKKSRTMNLNLRTHNKADNFTQDPPK